MEKISWSVHVRMKCYKLKDERNILHTIKWRNVILVESKHGYLQ